MFPFDCVVAFLDLAAPAKPETAAPQQKNDQYYYQ